MTQLPSDICKEHGIEAFKNNSFWQKVKISLFLLKPCLHKSVYLANLSSREQRVKSHREEAEALRVKPRKWHQPGSAVSALQRDTAAGSSTDTCEQTHLGQRKGRGRVNRIHEGRHGHTCAHSTATPPAFGQLGCLSSLPTARTAIRATRAHRQSRLLSVVDFRERVVVSEMWPLS